MHMSSSPETSDNEGRGAYPPIPEGNKDEEELPSGSENPEDHGIRVDPDYQDSPTVSELEDWNTARPTPESEVPDPEIAFPEAIQADWPMILHKVSMEMQAENPADDMEIVGLVGDLFEMNPLQVVHLESFETPVEREFQRRAAVEVYRAIQEFSSRGPPWKDALRRKPPQKNNAPKEALNNCPERTPGLRPMPSPSLSRAMGSGDQKGKEQKWKVGDPSQKGKGKEPPRWFPAESSTPVPGYRGWEPPSKGTGKLETPVQVPLVKAAIPRKKDQWTPDWEDRAEEARFKEKAASLGWEPPWTMGEAEEIRHRLEADRHEGLKSSGSRSYQVITT